MKTSDRSQGELLTAAGFYDRLEPDYDQMTGFEERFSREQPNFEALVRQHGIRSAVDAGCGTGLHAILLSRLGVDVIAIDASSKMVRKAKEHAGDSGVRLRAQRASFSELKGLVKRPVDAVFCLGNSLPHLLNDRDLDKALANFHAILRPGGVLFLQLLNYERILAERQSTQSIRESGGLKYIRSYEYSDPFVLFTVQAMGRAGEGLRSVTTRLRPLTSVQLLSALSKAGFVDAQFFGGMTLADFDAAASKDLVARARRPALSAGP